MAAIQCKNCGEIISEKTFTCPYCNETINKKLDIHSIVKKIIITITVAIVITILVSVDKKYTEIEVTKDVYEAGTEVNILDYVNPVNSNAKLKFVSNIDTKKLGKQKLKYRIENGIFKHTRFLNVEIVDTVAPVIVGPEELTVTYGEPFSIKNYFDVEDFEDGLDELLVPIPSIAKLKPGFFDVSLSVYDSSGNKAEKMIKVEVRNITEEERIVKKCIEMYLAEGHTEEEIGTVAYIIMEEIEEIGNHLDCIVLLGNGELYWRTTYDSLSRIGDETITPEKKSLLREFLITYGTKINYSSFIDQNL